MSEVWQFVLKLLDNLRRHGDEK